MKHILLGTTALVATGLVAGAASAAEGVKLGLGGYYVAGAGVLFDQDDSVGEPGHNMRDYGFRQDVEVHFKGETTLDNGLTVGATIQLEGQQSANDQIDEVWAYFKGGWGQIRFGDDDDAYEQLAYIIPSASNVFGVDTPFFSFANNFGGGALAQTNTTIHRLSGDATKLIYFSPSFGGFSFAASWAPDRRGEDTFSGFTGAVGGGAGGTPADNNTGQVSNVIALAANFEHDFNGFGVVAGLGGGHADIENVSGFDDDVYNIRGHLIVSFSGFTIGAAGSYVNNTNTGAPDTDLWTAGLGVTYNFDAWTVGLAWSHGEYERVVAGQTQDDNLDIIALTGRYDLGPGISLDATIEYNDYDDSRATAPADNETWWAGVGFYIGF